VSFGLLQKITASDTERRRLYHVVFERGSVCTMPDYKVLSTIPLAGALEVFSESSASHIGLASPVNLISWGIPVVRKGRFDYYKSDSSPDWHLIAGPHSGPPTAKLTTDSKYKGRYVIRARLTSSDDKVVAFDGEWLSGRDSDPHYCPGYFSAAKENEPPRSLLLSALVSHEGKIKPPPQQKLLFEGSGYIDMTVKRVEVIGKIQWSEFTGNMGCSDDVGLRHLRFIHANSSEKQFVPPPSWNIVGPQPVKTLHEELDGQGEVVFQAGDRFHFIRSLHLIEAVCSTQDAYLGFGQSATGLDTIFLQKRTLPHFQKVWQTDRRISFGRPAEFALVKYEKVYIYSVSEAENRLRVLLAYFATGSTKEGALVEVDAETLQLPQTSAR
jgi:hypothetical protein